MLSFWLLPGTCCSSSECKSASAMPFLTWKRCFSCGSYDKSFLTGPLLSIKYPCYHEDTFLCPATTSSFHLAGKETSSPHPEEASNTGTDIRVIFSDWWLRFYPSAAVYKPSGLILWTFPVPKVALSIFVPFASGRTRPIKTRSFASREWCCPSMYFLLVRSGAFKQSVLLSSSSANLLRSYLRNKLQERHGSFVDSPKAFCAFASGSQSIHPIRSLRITVNQTKTW